MAGRTPEGLARKRLADSASSARRRAARLAAMTPEELAAKEAARAAQSAANLAASAASTKARVANLLEDVEFMARAGETTEGAARRAGYKTVDGLDKILRAHGRRDIWERLRRNEVERFGATLGEIASLEKAAREKGVTRGPRQRVA